MYTYPYTYESLNTLICKCKLILAVHGKLLNNIITYVHSD